MSVLVDCLILGFFAALSGYVVFRLTPKMLNDYLLELNPISGREPRDKTLKIWFVLTFILGIVVFFQFKSQTTAIVFMLLLPFLFSLSYIDFKTCYLPDRLQVVCTVFAIAAFFIELLKAPVQSQLWLSRALAISVPLCVWLVGTAYEKLRKIEGLGFGDIKLLGWMAIYIDTDIISVLMVGVALALAVNIPRVALRKIDSQTPFAFGPYLIAGFLILGYLKGAFWAVDVSLSNG